MTHDDNTWGSLDPGVARVGLSDLSHERSLLKWPRCSRRIRPILLLAETEAPNSIVRPGGGLPGHSIGPSILKPIRLSLAVPEPPPLSQCVWRSRVICDRRARPSNMELV